MIPDVTWCLRLLLGRPWSVAGWNMWSVCVASTNSQKVVSSGRHAWQIPRMPRPQWKSVQKGQEREAGPLRRGVKEIRQEIKSVTWRERPEAARPSTSDRARKTRRQPSSQVVSSQIEYTRPSSPLVERIRQLGRILSLHKTHEPMTLFSCFQSPASSPHLALGSRYRQTEGPNYAATTTTWTPNRGFHLFHYRYCPSSTPVSNWQTVDEHRRPVQTISPARCGADVKRHVHSSTCLLLSQESWGMREVLLS